MGFMYLHLKSDDQGKIHATVQPDGTLPFVTLGSENTRWSGRPFAVFQIESFQGLTSIDTRDLELEVINRLGEDGLRSRLASELSTNDLLGMLRDRIPPA
jgi:hypothetical protein